MKNGGEGFPFSSICSFGYDLSFDPFCVIVGKLVDDDVDKGQEDER